MFNNVFFKFSILIIGFVIDVDNVLQRMTIVGVILSFRQLAQSAVVDVLQERIPFLLSSIQDYRAGYANTATSNTASASLISGGVNGVSSGVTVDSIVSHFIEIPLKFILVNLTYLQSAFQSIC